MSNFRCQQLGVLDSLNSVTFQRKLFLSLILLIYAVQNTELRLLRKARGVEFRAHYTRYRAILWFSIRMPQSPCVCRRGSTLSASTGAATPSRGSVAFFSGVSAEENELIIYPIWLSHVTGVIVPS